MSAFTIEKPFHIRAEAKGRKALRTDVPAKEAILPLGVLPRVVKLMALALHFDELTESGALASTVLGSLAQTIFDGGRIGARIEIQNALQEQARFAYQQAVLEALEEVENALVSLANFRSRATALGAAAFTV